MGLQFSHFILRFIQLKSTQLFTGPNDWFRFISFFRQVGNFISLSDEDVKVVNTKDGTGHVPEGEDLHFHFRIGMKLN